VAYSRALDDISRSGGKNLGNLDAVSIDEARLAEHNMA
jgi:hypothetical protein